MLTRIRKATEDREEGFTLVELLVVVIIIGILAAIAIPTFLNQREKAWARASQSDLRNAATILESHFSDNGTYVGATGFKTSDNVTVSLGATQTTATGYCVKAVHSKLADIYVLRDTVGRPQKVQTAAPAVADCS